MSLLNIDANAKTVKGQTQGYMTALLYLAPYIASGKQVCPFAKVAACWRDCLNVAGRGGMAKGNATFRANGLTLPDNAIQRARIRRTQQFHNDREGFMRDLVKEIDSFIRKAERKGLTPCVRLNGTSDIAWEDIPVSKHDSNIMEVFPALQFYDYTKNYKRAAKYANGGMPDNYYLCQSYSAANDKFKAACWEIAGKQVSLVIVARNADVKARLLDSFAEIAPTIDGDLTDLRFTDPKGSIVVLKAKGTARKDYSGFVID